MEGHDEALLARRFFRQGGALCGYLLHLMASNMATTMYYPYYLLFTYSVSQQVWDGVLRPDPPKWFMVVWVVGPGVTIT